MAVFIPLPLLITAILSTFDPYSSSLPCLQAGVQSVAEEGNFSPTRTYCSTSAPLRLAPGPFSSRARLPSFHTCPISKKKFARVSPSEREENCIMCRMLYNQYITTVLTLSTPLANLALSELFEALLTAALVASSESSALNNLSPPSASSKIKSESS